MLCVVYMVLSGFVVLFACFMFGWVIICDYDFGCVFLVCCIWFLCCSLFKLLVASSCWLYLVCGVVCFFDCWLIDLVASRLGGWFGFGGCWCGLFCTLAGFGWLICMWLGFLRCMFWLVLLATVNSVDASTFICKQLL